MYIASWTGFLAGRTALKAWISQGMAKGAVRCSDSYFIRSRQQSRRLFRCLQLSETLSERNPAMLGPSALNFAESV